MGVSMNFLSIARALLTLCTMVVVSGCTTFSGTAERVHSMPDNVQGKSFFVFPDNTQERTPEFALYSSDIAENLLAAGLVEAPNLTGADYIVQYRHVTGGPREVSTTSYETTGGEFTTQQAIITSGPAAGQMVQYEEQTPYSTRRVTGTETLYDRVLEVDISDRAASTAERIEYVYQGRVSSAGSNNSFMVVSRCMFGALLGDFPGPSGTSKTAYDPVGECMR